MDGVSLKAGKGGDKSGTGAAMTKARRPAALLS